MNIFKTTSYTWWQIGLLKIALLAIGIVIGAHWSEIFIQHTTLLVITGVILGIYLAVVWFKQ